MKALKLIIAVGLSYFLANELAAWAAINFGLGLYEMVLGSHLLFLGSLFFYAKPLQMKLFQKNWFSLKQLGWTCVIGFASQALITLKIALFGQGVLYNQEMIEQSLPYAQLGVAFVAIVITAPLVEEIVFRSLWLQNVCFKHQWLGFLIGTSLFALMHTMQYFHVDAFITYFLLGMPMSLIYMKTEKLEYAILWHVFNNTLAFLVLINGVNI